MELLSNPSLTLSSLRIVNSYEAKIKKNLIPFFLSFNPYYNNFRTGTTILVVYEKITSVNTFELTKLGSLTMNTESRLSLGTLVRPFTHLCLPRKVTLTDFPIRPGATLYL